MVQRKQFMLLGGLATALLATWVAVAQSRPESQTTSPGYGTGASGTPGAVYGQPPGTGYPTGYPGGAPGYAQGAGYGQAVPPPYGRQAPAGPGYPSQADAPAGYGGYGQPPQVVTVQQAETGATVVLGGTVVPYKEVTLSAQIPGRIEYIAGEEGDWVKEGEVLVAINDDDLLAKRRQILAEIANAESALRNAQVQYQRELWAPQSRSPSRAPGMGLPSMFDQMFTRPFAEGFGYGNPELERSADLYSSGTQVSQAQARVLQARSALEEIDAKIRDARSVAPFDGVIVKKLVEVGDTVQPGQPLVVFADTRYLQIQVEVPARLMPGIEKGMIFPARLDVGDTQTQVRVAQVFPMADPVRHTVTVKFDLPRGAPGGPGMYAEVMIRDVNVPSQVVPVIPRSAVVWRGSLPAVFVLNSEGRTELRMVRLGEPVDGDRVAVLSGLQPGERILANPPPGMASGWSTRAPAGRNGGGGR